MGVVCVARVAREASVQYSSFSSSRELLLDGTSTGSRIGILNLVSNPHKPLQLNQTIGLLSLVRLTKGLMLGVRMCFSLFFQIKPIKHFTTL